MTGRIRSTAVVGLALASAVLVGCQATGDGGPVDAAGLEGAYESKEALGRAVLEALSADDRAAMEALVVSREEHRDLLWPQLPERTYLTFERSWFHTSRNTRRALDQAMSRYGGRAFVFVSLEFTDEPEVYDGFTIHRGAELVARHEESGEVGELPILRVILEKEGHWKLIHYDE